MLHLPNHVRLNRLLDNWDTLPQEFKRGYHVGFAVYDPCERLKIVKEICNKRRHTDSDYTSLVYLSPLLRHTLLQGQYRVIKTDLPAYVDSYLRYSGVGSTLVHRSSAILVCKEEVLVDAEVNCAEMNRYIFETFHEVTDYTVHDITDVIPTDVLVEYDVHYGETYDSYFTDFETTNAQIQNPLCYIEKTMYETVIRNWGQVKQIHAPKTYLVNDKPVNFCDSWLSDSNKRTFLRMDTFPPPLVCAERVYNLWSGFNVKGDASLGTVEPFLNHLDLVIGGKDYLIKWFAQIIQQPGLKSLICPIIRGERGSGKSIIVDSILRMLGPELSHSTGKLGDVFEKHSHIRKNKVFINVDEVNAKAGIEHSEILKNAITALTFKFEPKGVNEITLSNFNRFFVTTDHTRSIHISSDERRYVVFGFKPDRIGDHAYFDSLAAWYQDDNNMRALYEYLEKVDITGFNFKILPQTDALIESKILSLPSIIKWWTYLIIENFPTNWVDVKIDNKLLYADFLHFIQVEKDKVTINKFGLDMKKYIEFDGLFKFRTNRGMEWTIDRTRAFEWLVEKHYTLETELFPTIDLEYNENY